MGHHVPHSIYVTGRGALYTSGSCYGHILPAGSNTWCNSRPKNTFLVARFNSVDSDPCSISSLCKVKHVSLTFRRWLCIIQSQSSVLLLLIPIQLGPRIASL